MPDGTNGGQTPAEIKDFAATIKAKYPEYADQDDFDLVDHVVRKYPGYAKAVNLPADYRLLKSTTGYQNLDDVYEQAGRDNGIDPNLLLYICDPFQHTSTNTKRAYKVD